MAYFALSPMLLDMLCPCYMNLRDASMDNVARSGAIGCGTTLQAGRLRVRFPILSLQFFVYIILPATLWPLGRLSL